MRKPALNSSQLVRADMAIRSRFRDFGELELFRSFSSVELSLKRLPASKKRKDDRKWITPACFEP